MTQFTEDEKLVELKAFMDTVKAKENHESYLIATLHKAQDLYGYLSKEVMNVIAETLRIPTAHIWGVATFYHYFKLVPQGKYTISVCMGTACYVKGAAEILDTVREHLNVKVGETSDDGIFTLQEARCLGACGLAPVMMIDDKIYGNLTPKSTREILNELRKNSK